MTRVELVIVGAGGFGREVLGYAQDAFAGRPAHRVAGFADDNPRALDGFDLAAKVLGRVHDIPISEATRFVVAVGHPAARRALAAAVESRGGRLLTVVHPSAYIGPGARLGDGCVVCPFAFVGTAATIGANTAINVHASAGHDAITGGNCVFSPYSAINGGVELRDDVFLGTHATVFPGRTVGHGAKISAGAVVHRDVPAGALAVGNPAKSRVLFALDPG
ncbi:NeuD/PglB/VioB family sugar acetyltransferase [Actinoplanes sp. L3-i22]|uniref:NeuD/PglB/VioB family sugar acetyltransferase n=1 Tax=Actinoplanes sp. L3-i22 TaxID=2836373 RepID=UPI001C787F5F|nr:NeuD/PglB/VioB family sugar acetyltransferase [Actinoplanes sp. L3-i22]BCY10578.1 transferase [Actinoplanes sp. L3-i22]